MIRLVIFLYAIVLFACLNAADLKVSDENCSCYQPGHREAPIDQIQRYWMKLKKDVMIGLPRTKIPYEDLFECKEEYEGIFNAISPQYRQINKDVSSLKPAFYPNYYSSDFERLFDALQKLNDFHEEWDIFILKYKYEHNLLRNAFYNRYHSTPNDYDEQAASIRKSSSYNYYRWNNTRKEIWRIFELIHSNCLKKHINLISLYEYGYFQAKKGNYYTSLQTIKKLIHHSKISNKTKYLTSGTYLTLGVTSSLAHEYAEAIEALSEAISKDPTCIDAYIERAIAYFEIGNFEEAIKDYLSTNLNLTLKPSTDPYKLQFAKGFLQGAPKGSYMRALEIPATIADSIRGIGQVLWAACKNPIDVPQQMIDSITESIDFLLTHDARAISKEIAPELHELLQKWRTLDPESKGEQAGLLLGKYGIDIISGKAAAKSLQLSNKLRHTNALCNLKELSLSTTGRGSLITAIEVIMKERQEFFSKAKIHADKQGKHLSGHRNFIPTNHPSILTYPDPEALLKKYAGKGRPRGKLKPGKVGYKEVIECDEIIGDFVDDLTKKSVPTKRATIHYDKHGMAHIVPASPLT